LTDKIFKIKSLLVFTQHEVLFVVINNSFMILFLSLIIFTAFEILPLHISQIKCITYASVCLSECVSLSVFVCLSQCVCLV